MDYETLDYLPDLKSAERAAADFLPFEFESTSSVGWDRTASVAGRDDFAILHDTYKILAIKGATYDLASVSFFDPFVLLIFDKFGNAIVANSEADDQTFSLSDGVYESDLIPEWVAPYTGVFYVQASWDQGAYYDFYALLIHEDINTIPLASGARIFVDDGYEGTVAGQATIFGTRDSQHLKLGLGVFRLDASFNRGGDVVELPGDAADYTILARGSDAVLEGFGATYTIPIGTAGLPLVFEDGARVLRAVSGVLKIGSQTIGDTPVAISGAAGPDPQQVDIDDGAVARLFMNDAIEVELGGDYNVFGTSAAELVSYVGGDLTLDTSFNRGGDRLLLFEDAGEFTAKTSGSTVIISGDDGTITIPVGRNGMAIDFFGDERILLYDQATAHYLIGTQVITGNEVTLA